MIQHFDLIIIGGGINGCACAADAALRGLKVLLCEQNELASETSSKSSKLIHGGLRYLEYYDFLMVRHALQERETLLRLAPHLIHPLPFVLPMHQNSRPEWMLRTGLFFYDHLFHSQHFPHHKTLQKIMHPDYFSPLHPAIHKAFLYYDAQTNDQRLVIHNALQAKKYGATILTHTPCIDIQAHHDVSHWTVKCHSKKGELTFFGKVLINASGSHVEAINQKYELPQKEKLSFIQGSHIIVPKQYPGDHAYILQDPGSRILFVLPHGPHHSLIGTTEKELSQGAISPKITTEEQRYLLQTFNHYFNAPLTQASIMGSFSGIRTLVRQEKNSTATSRDYAYELHSQPKPYVNILSGKITTYRKLGEQVMNALSPFFPKLPPSKTADTPLIGAPIGQTWLDYQTSFRKKYNWLSFNEQTHYLTTYGALSEKILEGIKDPMLLSEAEQTYLKEEALGFSQ